MDATEAATPADPVSPRGKVAERLALFHQRWRRLFWTLHSIWALATGAAVLVLAHNRYGFVPWVVLFLVLTWASTLFFSRLSARLVSPAGRFAQGFVSYLTRVMYQETLFFLLPFYIFSTTVPSANAPYTVLLGVLAVLSCLDLPFDRLLRTTPAFSLLFFFVVAFSALQLLLPLVLHLPVRQSSLLSAAGAYLSAASLATGGGPLRGWRHRGRLAAGLVLSMAAVRLALPCIPPVPLRVTKVRFACELDRVSKRAPRDYEGRMPLDQLQGGELYAIATIFAPTHVASSMSLQLLHAGETLRRSHDIDLVANRGGYRIWDVARAPAGGFKPGSYTLRVLTREGQLVGRATLQLVPGSGP